MAIVHIVELNLYEIPLELIVARQEIVEYLYVAVIRKSEIADASRLTLFQQEVEQPLSKIVP